ncbi:MAG TPA: acyl carrier protein [Kofleriaceae bacterium]|jgi:acyl carrier protein|nr:acyl carrier protein [Kofleriaceae bacterium]
MNDTKAMLKTVLVKSLRLDRSPDSVPENNLASELGIDSLKSLEFLVWVENEFGIEIDDSDLSVKLIDSLDYLASYIERKQAARTGQTSASA